jgi:predicted DNA-binding transcriptional regulator AlpA
MTSNARERLKAVEAAQYLRVSRSTLAKWRMKGTGPACHHCGPRIVYYFRDEIDSWLAECDRRSASAHTEVR